MPGNTQYYALAYFSYGDALDSIINAKLEVDRFVTIDKQFYGLYNIFGDGVISGLEVFDNGYKVDSGISVGINPGIAIIKKLAIETDTPLFVLPLVPNSTLNIFATTEQSSNVNRTIKIFQSTADSFSPAIKLATVVTGNTGVTSIDNTVRTYIGFEQSILTAINSHKHRGSPTKVDLQNEAKNQLPAARIEGFDVEKLTTGRLDEARIPVLSHSSLDDIGALSHPQIDTILNLMSDQNLGLFGNVATVNLIRQYIFLRYKYDDADEFMVNGLLILPGVTPTSYYDTEATTAWIAEDVEWCIIGFPITTRDTYFYTQNFTLPARPKKIILTSHKSVPDNSELTFGVNTTNSVDWDDYTEVADGAITDVPLLGTNIRIGIKFVWNGDIPATYTIESTNFTDYINFFFTNSDSSQAFHFRMRFYENFDGSSVSNLYFTADSRTNQERWFVSDNNFDDAQSIPCAGYIVDQDEEVIVSYYPDLSRFLFHKRYYVVVDVWDGDSYEFETSPSSFRSSIGSNVGPCDLYDFLPLVKNFGVMFELENGQLVTLNQ